MNGRALNEGAARYPSHGHVECEAMRLASGTHVLVHDHRLGQRGEEDGKRAASDEVSPHKVRVALGSLVHIHDEEHGDDHQGGASTHERRRAWVEEEAAQPAEYDHDRREKVLRQGERDERRQEASSKRWRGEGAGEKGGLGRRGMQLGAPHSKFSHLDKVRYKLANNGDGHHADRTAGPVDARV